MPSNWLGCLLLGLPFLVSAQSEAQHRHCVRSGDTLFELQRQWLRADIDWQALQRLNRVADPYRLRPGSCLHWPQSWMRERPAQAELLFVIGTVELERQGQWQRLQGGELLRDGDRLRSASQSSASLRFADGARLLLRPDSQLSIDRLTQSRNAAQTRVELHEGAADSQVPSERKPQRRFEIRTPVANLGVRGTQFRSRLAGATLHLEVLQGQVAARWPEGAQAVAAGQGLSSAGRPSAAQALPQAPAAPQLHRSDRLPLVWQWPAQADAQSYRLQVWDAAGQRLLLDALPPTAHWQGGAELPDGDYRLRLRAVGASGLEGQDTEQAFALRARPEPPFLQGPGPAAQLYAPAVEFQWARNAAAAGYRLQLARTEDFAAPEQDLQPIDGQGLRLELTEGVHHWRVASLREDGSAGPWSDPQSLTRLPPPAAPAAAQAERQGELLRLRWPAAAPGLRYQVQVAVEPGFDAPWADQQTDAPSLELKPSQGGIHHVRVRCLSPDGVAGPWGSSQSVEWPQPGPWWWLLLPALVWLL